MSFLIVLKSSLGCFPTKPSYDLCILFSIKAELNFYLFFLQVCFFYLFSFDADAAAVTPISKKPVDMGKTLGRFIGDQCNVAVECIRKNVPQLCSTYPQLAIATFVYNTTRDGGVMWSGSGFLMPFADQVTLSFIEESLNGQRNGVVPENNVRADEPDADANSFHTLRMIIPKLVTKDNIHY